MIPMIQQALTMGYTTIQILKYISSKFKSAGTGIANARKQGYSDEDILKFLSGKFKPKNQKRVDEQLSAQEKYLKASGIKTKDERKQTRDKYLSNAIGLGATALGAYNMYQNYSGIASGLQSVLGQAGNNPQPTNPPTPNNPNLPPPSPTTPQPTPNPIQGGNIVPQGVAPQTPGQQIGQGIQAPITQALQPSDPNQIAQASQAIPDQDQMQQMPQEQMPMEAEQQQIPIFEQLLGGIDTSTLEPEKQQQLKFLSMISDQLQSKGKGINDPEFKNLSIKIKNVLKGKPGTIIEENARFQAGQDAKNANVKPALHEESVKNHPLFEELKTVGSEISPAGMVKLYHRTTSENADKIKNSGVLKTKENAAFFSTKREGQNEGYGDEVVEFEIPINKLELDDIFGDEAHVRIDLGNKRELNVKDYLKKQPVSIVEPAKITKPDSIKKGESVVTEDGNVAEVKGTSGNNFLIEENGKIRQVPMDSLRSQPEAIKKAKIVFDPSKVPESERSAALAISLPMPDRSAIINMFHDGSFYVYRRKDGKPIDESIIRRVIDGQDMPISSGETFMGAWNQDTGDSRGSASFKELTAMAQDATKEDDPTKELIFEKITDQYTHGYIKEIMKLFKETGKNFSAKAKKPKK